MRCFRARAFVWLVTCLALIFWGLAATAQQDGTDLDRLAAGISAVDGIDELTQSCPDDIWKSRMGWRGLLLGGGASYGWGACQLDADMCLTKCGGDDNGSACFFVGRLIETGEGEALDMASRKAFSLACALGYPAGCTNRAAGLRNAPIKPDALSQDRSDALWSCLQRSFSTACKNGNAWGCSMEGQAHRLGEGTKVDPGAARASLTKACRLSAGPEGEDTGAAPCRFAKNQLRLLGIRD